ncbi:MAG: hypothetical protein U9Q83_03635, partial [Bacteroidota bacterium]|nr:hypothetical protein [Bacteroidota bacterium]
EITLQSGACGTTFPAYDYRFYVGVNYNEKDNYDGMYSFFPAQKYDENSKQGFKRPVIDLSDIDNYSETSINDFECSIDNLPIIDHKLQARGGARVVCIRNQEKIKEIWLEIKKQVKKEDLFEGIYTEVPAQKNIPYKTKLHKNYFKLPKSYIIPNFNFSEIEHLHIKIKFRSDNNFGGLIGCQNDDFNPQEFQPVLYVDKTGYLRAKLWDGEVDKTLKSDKKVIYNEIHEVEYFANFITGDQILKIDTEIHKINSDISRNQSTNIWQLGIVYLRYYPIHYRGRKITTVCGWFPFNGDILSAKIFINNKLHYKL